MKWFTYQRRPLPVELPAPKAANISWNTSRHSADITNVRTATFVTPPLMAAPATRGVIACPVTALKAWLEAAAITEGAVFRPIAKGGRIQATRLTDRSVADIVKAHAQRAGLDPRLFAGHSLRSGFLTSAAARGASIFKMADQSRHKSMDTLRGYVRDAEIFKRHAGEGLL